MKSPKSNNEIQESAVSLLRKVLPSLDVLAEIWRFLRVLWENTTSVGMYEVLNHTALLEIRAKSGNKATFSKSQKVRYLQNNIIAYQDQAWGEGDILLNYECLPGTVVDKYKPAATTYILISLRETKQKGDIDNFEIRWEAKDAFLQDREVWGTAIDHRTKSLQLEIIFPQDRPPIKIKFVEQFRKRQLELGTEKIVKLPDGKWRVTHSVEKPRLYERYFFEWEW